VSTQIDDATLAAIEQQLGRTGVWVSPELRSKVPPAAEKQIEAALAQAPTPTYVALVQIDTDDDLTDGSFDQLAAVIRDDTDHQGTYLGLDYKGDLDITSFPQELGLYQATRIAALEHPGDLPAQVLDVLSLLRSGTDLDAKWDAVAKTDPDLAAQLTGTATEAHSSDAGGSSWVIGGGIVIAIAVVAALVSRSVRRGRGGGGVASGKRTFALPTAVLRTVRAAEDTRNEETAQSEILALGEAIEATTMDPRRSKANTAWQAALDHYDVARRIMDRQHSPADVVGAIVLARRGSSALTAAAAGRGWKPVAGCYFNPLHGVADTRVVWRDGDRSVRVPSCRACAADVERNHEPRDVLDFVQHDLPRHYFLLDLGAWSRTAYGALDTDLLGELLRQ
jgi:hypothetical protein